MMVVAALLAAVGMAGARAQETFDACDLFTQDEAQKALGSDARPEPVNPKVKRPRFVPTCTYFGSKYGKAISASASFKFARNEAEAQRAFDEERLKFQTKPMLIGAVTGFWSSKQGQVHLLKGRVSVTVAVGGALPAERDADLSRKLAEALVKKL
jgi:hypothetical protein